MTLTKAAIIDKIYNQCGFSKSESIQLTEKLLEIIKSTLDKGEDVLISGFGKFYVQAKKKRKGRNPQTGEDMILDDRKVIVFKCSGKLREKMNKK
ncbi:MAG: integration host factor subunit alpha [Deltaproteobacteria bacterium]|nr:integration host factor subunit alpha [Deltaproteobacteria bacterium]MBW2119441.1 integration host factor subunit alpha [Deltaproteobacteria bacterium]MBW2342881.1 integration host factor subunit alpha [Deltaproteobacteria bacterium]